MKTIRAFFYIFTFGIIMVSCAVRPIDLQRTWVYENIGYGMYRPDCLILKTSWGTYDLDVGGNRTIGGVYEIRGDTLCLTPKYMSAGGKVANEYNADSEEDVFSIQLFFLIKGKKLVDITEYEKYSDLAALGVKNGSVYKVFERIKIKR